MAKFEDVISWRDIGGKESQRIILAASPIVKSPATMPYRVVLVKLSNENKLVVWYQTFSSLKEESNIGWASFSDGSYFDLNDIEKATTEFCRRTVDRFAIDAKIALERG